MWKSRLVIGFSIVLFLLSIYSFNHFYGGSCIPYTLKGLIIQQLKACGWDCKGISKEAIIFADKGSKICYKQDLWKMVSADEVNFKVDESLSSYIKVTNNGTCIEFIDNVKNKRALLYVRCNDGNCTVSLSKP